LRPCRKQKYISILQYQITEYFEKEMNWIIEDKQVIRGHLHLAIV
jgi:hypothetical protein